VQNSNSPTQTSPRYGNPHDVLLLEAVEYLAARCRRVTKHVIFHAASWSAYAWVAHREAFSLSGASPIPKLVGSEPIPLDPPC
jgi:hypothetical protein